MLVAALIAIFFRASHGRRQGRDGAEFVADHGIDFTPFIDEAERRAKAA